MCWCDRAILDGYQCKMTHSVQQNPPLGRTEEDKRIRKKKKRIGFSPLWLILFCFVICGVYFEESEDIFFQRNIEK